MASLDILFDTLKQRKRPEDVADLVLSLLKEKLAPKEEAVLEKAARGALRRSVLGYTSMAVEFAKPVGAERQVNKAIEIFRLVKKEAVDYNEYEHIENFVKTVSPLIHKSYGQNNFRSDRLNKEQREAKGLDLSKRGYNKRWRLLKRIERKLLTLSAENRKREFQQIARHGLAHHISREEFSADLDTACFIAYYTSRCNLRSEFTIAGQTRAFDEISNMLLKRCTGNRPGLLSFFRKDEPVVNTANWWAIAHVYPGDEVLKQLSDEQKGMLLGKWTAILQDIAFLLRDLWNSNDIERKTMIVKKKNDSTTWNNTAGAWNKARDNWMNLLYATGMEGVLDELCFGKVLRLMAADVAYWHRSAGGGLDPNTEVWNKLPLPWEVFEGKETCTKPMVVAACAGAKIDPEKSGWIAPRVHAVVEFRPTPELVHGVTVSNPFLATVLKRHRYFSGKSATGFSPADN